MEQLDFGLLEHKAKGEGWYTHKGFYVRKLKTPDMFDQGREKAPEDRLRMPNITVTDDELRALTTLLVGSIDSPFLGNSVLFPSSSATFRPTSSGIFRRAGGLLRSTTAWAVTTCRLGKSP